MSSKTLSLLLAVLTGLVLVLGSSTAFLLLRLLDRGPEPGPPSWSPALSAPTARPAPPQEAEGPVVRIGEHFTRFDGKPSYRRGSWPAFQGPSYDGVSRESVRLAGRWKETGPPEVWSVELTDGYTGPVVHRGRVYVLDYDRAAQVEALRCLSLDDGKEIWRRGHSVKLINQHGFQHTTPAVSEDYVVALGAKGHLMCLDPITGELRWGLDLVGRLGSRLKWNFCAQNPLIDGSTIVVATGAEDSLLVGLDGASGKVLWKTPSRKAMTLSFSSVVLTKLNGRKVYLYGASGGAVAVSAEAGSAGKLLWETSDWTPDYPTPTPVPLEDGLVFLTSGFNSGAMLIRAPVEGERNPRILWTRDVRDGFSSDAHTPLYHGRHLFAVLPDAAGDLRKQFACMDPHGDGKIVWSSGKERRFGMCEPYLLADGKFFVLDRDGFLTVIRATPERYEELARAQILKNTGEWHPWMALAGGRLIVRDYQRLVCFALQE